MCKWPQPSSPTLSLLISSSLTIFLSHWTFALLETQQIPSCLLAFASVISSSAYKFFPSGGLHLILPMSQSTSLTPAQPERDFPIVSFAPFSFPSQQILKWVTTLICIFALLSSLKCTKFCHLLP